NEGNYLALPQPEGAANLTESEISAILLRQLFLDWFGTQGNSQKSVFAVGELNKDSDWAFDATLFYNPNTNLITPPVEEKIYDNVPVIVSVSEGGKDPFENVINFDPDTSF